MCKRKCKQQCHLLAERLTFFKKLCNSKQSFYSFGMLLNHTFYCSAKGTERADRSL